MIGSPSCGGTVAPAKVPYRPGAAAGGEPRSWGERHRADQAQAQKRCRPLFAVPSVVGDDRQPRQLNGIGARLGKYVEDGQPPPAWLSRASETIATPVLYSCGKSPCAASPRRIRSD